jgi:multidrug efflux pump subunit AcrB
VRGDPAVQLRVDRNDAGDAIGMQAAVARAAAEMQATLPEGVTIELIRTRAEGITDRLDILWRNGVMGLALVVGSCSCS